LLGSFKDLSIHGGQAAESDFVLYYVMIMINADIKQDVSQFNTLSEKNFLNIGNIV
jgi:hypothetical protein